jgi:hypothetical protein
MISNDVARLIKPLALLSLFLPSLAWGQDLPEEPVDTTAVSTLDDGYAPQAEESSFALHGRFRVGTNTSALNWSQTSDDTTQTYPPEASFSHAPFAGPSGISVQTELWWDEIAALDISFSWATYNLNVANETVSDSVLSAMVGFRGGIELTSVITAEWGIWYHHSDVVAFAYEAGANRASASKQDSAFDGVRIGGAAVADLDFMVARLGVYETFGIAPINTMVEVAGDVPVFELGPEDNGYPVVLRLSYAADIRHIGDSAGDVTLSITEVYHTLGAALAIELDYLNELF